MKLVLYLGLSTVGGMIGAWLGSLVGGMVTSFSVSMIGTAVGVYYARKLARDYFA